MPEPRLLPPATVPQQVGWRSHTTLVVAALVAALVLTGLSAIQPAPALGSTTLATRCDGVALRTRPRSTAHRVARLPKGARVIAVAVVAAGSWKTVCAGKTTRGDRWYRISRVNGKSVSSLYGVPYVYAAKSQFRVTSYTLRVRCDGTRLRTKPSTSARTKVKLAVGDRVKAIKVVSSGSWSTNCPSSVTGRKWYRIVKVNGKRVSSLYGVNALYGAKPLFTAGTLSTPTPTPTPTPAPTPTPTPDPPSPYIEGIDVSHWQGTINWPLVSAAGKQFTFIKATDGQIQSDGSMYVDPKYATNRSQAEANGLYAGAYHFARPDTTTGDAAAEADHFIDTAQWHTGELLPVLDLETTGGLGTAKLQAWVQAFLGRIYDRTGVRAMIYVSPYFWSSKMGDTTWFALNGYKTLWIAHWTTASGPTVPANNWGGNGWTFWQYTSSGSVSGISGNVDLDRYRFTNFSQVLIK